MANETRHGAAAPRRGHRVVLAQDLVDELALRYGHSPGAAAWAVHQAVRRGLLSAEMGVAVERPVVGWRPDENSSVVRARGLYGSHADHPGRQVPVYGAEVRRPLAPSDRPVPFTCLLVRSTDALWEGRAGRAAGPSNAPPAASPNCWTGASGRWTCWRPACGTGPARSPLRPGNPPGRPAGRRPGPGVLPAGIGPFAAGGAHDLSPHV